MVVLSAGGVGLRWENWVDVEADEKAPMSSGFGLAPWDTGNLRGGVQQPRIELYLALRSSGNATLQTLLTTTRK